MDTEPGSEPGVDAIVMDDAEGAATTIGGVTVYDNDDDNSA
jgi:hypothetical protein